MWQKDYNKFREHQGLYGQGLGFRFHGGYLGQNRDLSHMRVCEV